MLVILVVACGWLLTVQRLSVLEAGGALVFLGLAAAVVIDRVVDGRRPAAGELTAAIEAIASAPGGNTQTSGRS
ncbi:hypothetical protein [Micromonospora sp. DT233]|uniref:hypothetical protein n=1 Tax=Micromonospora sp. DT233 TaxID=3393432 RepID=UPI003CF57C1E